MATSFRPTTCQFYPVLSIRNILQTTTAQPPAGRDSTQQLSSSISRGTIFGVLSSFTQVASRLVIVPLAISHLGLDGYGIWSTLIAISLHMRFGSVGLKSAFQKYVAEATGDGDFEKASKLLSTGSAAMLVLSILGLIPVALVSGSVAQLAGVPPAFQEQAATSITMLALVMVLVNVGAAYEAIVMGGHRTDLTRKFATVGTLLETVASITLLQLGFGLVALAVTMAVSQFFFVGCCFVASTKVLPQIKVGASHISKGVIRELVRFAGSYQLVGILQIAFNAMGPLIILKAFGASQAGVMAVSSRLISPVTMCQYAFVLPILSSGAMIFASGSVENMRALLMKSLRISLFITLLPLMIVATFGASFIAGWTGQEDPQFEPALWMLSLTALFQAFSVLAAVLYRSSGSASLDNWRELVRLTLLVPIAVFSKSLGFLGVLGCLAAADLVGMIFMLTSLGQTFRSFEPKKLIPDALKVILSACFMIVAGAAAAQIAMMISIHDIRLAEVVRAVAIGLAIAASAYPALTMTGAITPSEVRSIVGTLRRRS